MISRRDALAGTASTASMLAAPSVLALPPAPGLPSFPDECITFEYSGILPEDSHALCAAFHNHRFDGGFYDYRRHDATRDQLVGTYYARDFRRAPFPFHWAWHLIGAARFAQTGGHPYRQAFFELLSDGRNRFVIPDHVARTLQVQPLAGRCMFEKGGEWLTISRYDSEDTLKIRRRDGIGV